MEKGKRNSSVEILRIISMFFIILSHYTVHNGVNNAELPVGINRIILEISKLGNIGVILFMLISGYFLIDSDKFKLKKLVKLILQVFFYSITVYGIFCLCGLVEFSAKDLLLSLFPIVTKQYWFVTAYVVIFVFHKFINILLKSLTKKQWQLLLVVCLFLFSLIPTLTNRDFDFYGSELIQFFLYYSLGAYIKTYGLDFISKKTNVIILIFSVFFLILSVVAFDFLSLKFPEAGKFADRFFDRFSLIAIAFAVSLFNCFVTAKPIYNNIVNVISSAAFGVYLIHENRFMRDFLWGTVFKSKDYVLSRYLVLHLLISVILTYIVCVLIDLIRQYLIEKPLFRVIGSKIDKLQEKLTNKFADAPDKV